MTRNRTNIIIISIIVIALIIIGALLIVQHSRNTPNLQSFVVQNQIFEAKGHNLGRVEIWAIPTGTNVAESDYLHLTNMVRISGNDSEQDWVAAIPVSPLLITQVFVRAYDAQENLVASSSLPYTGATEIYNAIWASSTAATSTTATTTAH